MVTNCTGTTSTATYTIVDGGSPLAGGLVGTVDGGEIVRAEISGPTGDADQLGTALAEELLEHGAADILRELYADA